MVILSGSWLGHFDGCLVRQTDSLAFLISTDTDIHMNIDSSLDSSNDCPPPPPGFEEVCVELNHIGYSVAERSPLLTFPWYDLPFHLTVGEII